MVEESVNLERAKVRQTADELRAMHDHVSAIKGDDVLDPRALALARTNLEQACLWFEQAVYGKRVL